ncbi:MAG: ABC transporter substrate-binding protein [Gammaproteobacteria bacterium]
MRLRLLSTAGLALALALGLLAPLATAAERIVAVGGAVTEIVFALGAGDRLVAVDTTSRFPDAATRLPDVGYLRTLSAEPILALRPDLVLHAADAGPPEALAQLRAAGVPLVAIPDAPSAAGVEDKIRATAEALGQADAATGLIARLHRELAAARAAIDAGATPPRVVFAMQFDAGSVLAAGRETAADAIIRLAGGRNVAGDFTSYKPIGAEGLLVARPDVVVTVDRAVAQFARPADALALPALRLTPAAATGRIVVMDPLLLLGFGPRLGEAVTTLAGALHAVP